MSVYGEMSPLPASFHAESVLAGYAKRSWLHRPVEYGPVKRAILCNAMKKMSGDHFSLSFVVVFARLWRLRQFSAMSIPAWQ